MTYQLKVKAKTLAAEAQIIRREERKNMECARRVQRLVDVNHRAGDETDPKLLERARRARAAFFDLQSHRKLVVRKAARSTHLARAYLAGRRYREVEAFAYTTPTASEIAALVQRYGVLDAARQPITVAEWLEEPAQERGLSLKYVDEASEVTEAQVRSVLGDDSGFVSPAAA